LKGDYKSKAKAILVDDAVGFGQTKLKAIQDCKKEGIIIKHIVCFYNAWWPKNKPFLAKLNKRGITFDALYTRKDWNVYLLKKGHISKQAFKIQNAYLDNPKSWHKDKKMWHQFLAWRKKALKTGKL